MPTAPTKGAIPPDGTIARSIYEYIKTSPRPMYANEIAAAVHTKENSTTAACFDLYERDIGIKVARRSDPKGRIAAVFWYGDKPAEGRNDLLPYVKRPIGSARRKPDAAKTTPPAETSDTDVLLSFSVKNRTGEPETMTLNFEQGEALYHKLHRIFGGAR